MGGVDAAQVLANLLVEIGRFIDGTEDATSEPVTWSQLETVVERAYANVTIVPEKLPPGTPDPRD